MFIKCMKYLLGCLLIVLFLINFLVTPFIIVTSVTLYNFLLIPFASLRAHRRKAIHMIMSLWMHIFRMIYIFNNWYSLDVEAMGGVKKDGNYILVCNHASWFDIVLLSTEVGPYVPQYKFILKKILLWALPVSGFVPWLLDFPFLNRFSHKQLKKNPQLRNADINIIRDSCKIFRNYSSTLIIFPEGTRFTDNKHNKQNSSFMHLLKPKVTGMAIAVDELRDKLDGIIDVTINYSINDVSFIDFIMGKVKRITITNRVIPIPNEIKILPYDDPEFRRSIKHLLNDIWQYKDHELSKLRT